MTEPTTTPWLHLLTPALEEMGRFLAWADETYGMHLGKEANPGQYPDAPGGATAFVVTVQPRRGGRWAGRFTPEVWRDKDGVLCHEIALSAEDLLRPTDDVLETLLHEAVHGRNWRIGLKDCSKSGRHNKLFAETARQCGLVPPDKAGPKGFDRTAWDPKALAYMHDTFVPNETAFQLARQAMQVKPKQPTKMKKWVCKCSPPTIARCATELVANCGLCGADFEKEGE